MARFTTIITRVKNPDHTGKNRCQRCTVVNVALAVLVFLAIGGTISPRTGFIVFILCLLVIYLRGYLIPGTPAITERYFPASVLRLFGKSSDVDRSFDDVDIDDVLVTAGAVTDADSEVCLSDNFRSQWRGRIRAIRARNPGPEDVAIIFDADRVDAVGKTSFVVDGALRMRWESSAALIADVAAAAELRSRFDEWESLEWSQRRDILTKLRLFLKRCPRCDEPLSTTQDDVDPCCQPVYTIVRSTCLTCDESIVERRGADLAESLPSLN